MSSKFKCCKNKENNNWFCVVCKNFIHPSCWKRTNQQYAIINENLIYCSNLCKQAIDDIDKENVFDDLRRIITELRAETDEKTKHINRLKRNSTTLVEEAEKSETQLLDEIDSLKQIINQLKKRVMELTSENNANHKVEYNTNYTQTVHTRTYDSETQTGEPTCCNTTTQTEVTSRHTAIQTDILPEVSANPNNNIEILIAENRKMLDQIDVLSTENSKLSSSLEEMYSLKDNFITSIETLTAENQTFLNDLKKANSKILLMQEVLPSQQSTVKSTAGEYLQEKHRKPQVLVYGNRTCTKGIGWLIKTFSSSRYDTCSHFPEMQKTFDDLVMDAARMAQKLTRSDFLILFAGNVNALRGTIAGNLCWSNVAEISRNTNLIIVTPPFCDNRKILNNFIYKLNMDIKKQMNGANSGLCINSDNFMSPHERDWYGNMRYETKQRISKFICTEFLEVSSTNFSGHAQLNIAT